MYRQLRTIYDALEDHESKMIFEKRCMFSLSGNKKYLDEMILWLIERYRQSDQMYDLIRWLGTRKKKYLVVFGAGFAGRELVEALEVSGITVSYISDNNPLLHGSIRYGKEIISVEQLVKMKEEAAIVLGTNLYAAEMYGQLTGLGFRPEYIYMPRGQWWLGHERQYFDSQIMIPGESEVFIDGGAYKGEDTIAFTKWCNGQYQDAYVFEPDKNNYQDTCQNLLDAGIVSQVFHRGLWSKSEKMGFSSGIQASSHVDLAGNGQIQMSSVDEVLQGKRASFIKMDVEGCELEAIAGASETIEKYHPRLAVCVYHKPEDIFEIPAAIMNLDPHYRLYLRHYSYIFTETVLYAVPET